MARLAQIPVKLNPHDLLRGSTRNVAHLKEDVRGCANTAVATLLGQSMSTFMNNVTEQVYTGGSAVSVWNSRAESRWIDPRAPDAACKPLTSGQGPSASGRTKALLNGSHIRSWKNLYGYTG